jgi:hypothetical protein
MTPASFVSVAFDSGCRFCCGRTDSCSLNRLPLFELEESIDGFLPAVQNAPEFSTAAVANTNDVAQRNSFSSNFGGDGPAKEAVFVEDANFRHIAWIVAYRHVFSHIGYKRQRQISQTLKVNAIAANLSWSDLFD